MTALHTIAGVSFGVHNRLPGLPTDGYADSYLTAVFTDTDAIGIMSGGTAQQVGGPGGLTAAVDPVAARCWLPDESGDPRHRSWHLRQLAPIFAAVLGRLTLHAGAIDTPAGVVGFIGASGAGKSTLTTHLVSSGYGQVADDLLPIRFEPGPTVPIHSGARPLAALYFMRRAPSGGVTASRLRDRQAFELQIAHGFGEHGRPELWAMQFDGYHRLVESVPHFELVIPDEITAIGDVEAMLRTSGFEPLHRRGEATR